MLVSIVFLGCIEENPRSRIINPNGDSELALLMREMFEDGMRTKQQILDGKEIRLGFDYRSIHSAEATESEKVKTTEYMLMAKAYEASVDSLLASEGPSRADAFQLMISTCANCHKTMCPGPMVKIRKMYLTDDEASSLQ